MKKIILFFVLLFSIISFAQIKVVKTESLIEIGKENSVSLYKKDNKYTFNYQDVNTTNLNSFRNFSFLNVNKDFEGFYRLISDGFANMPASDITLELPNDILDLHYEKNYGQITVQFVQYVNKNKKIVGKTHFLTKKQVDKIFGADKFQFQTNPYIAPSTEASNTKGNTPKKKKRK